MTNDYGRGKVIAAINEQSRQWDSYAQHKAVEAIRAKGSHNADKVMAEASELLARQSACAELASKAADIVNGLWPHDMLWKAEKLASDVRAFLECNDDRNREELKASYFIYNRAREKHE